MDLQQEIIDNNFLQVTQYVNHIVIDGIRWDYELLTVEVPTSVVNAMESKI